MKCSQKEMEVIEYAALAFFNNRNHYQALLERSTELTQVTQQIIEDGQRLRRRNKIDKDTFVHCKRDIHLLLEQKRMEKKRTRFLSKPKEKVETLLEKKKGVQLAKTDTNTFLLRFDDGEELEINAIEGGGISVSLNGIIHIYPERIY
jgi:hypothetical protein